jgi:type II secretory pathway pseudopilin PulG
VTGTWRITAQSSGGHSLVELLVVLTCAAILLSMAIPNLARMHQEWILWGSVHSVEASLFWGRMHAISSNTPLVFEISEDKKSYYWADPESGAPLITSVHTMPVGTRMAAYPKRSLRFYPRGNAVPAGTYTIEGESGSYSVVVSPGGRIRTQRN